MRFALLSNVYDLCSYSKNCDTQTVIEHVFVLLSQNTAGGMSFTLFGGCNYSHTLQGCSSFTTTLTSLFFL